jgi:hypothetical protein
MTINHIEMPWEYSEICNGWYGGQGCMLYAVCSTGGLTTGTIRPRRDDDGCPMSDEEWYYSLWVELSGDVAYAARAAEAGHNGDSDIEDAATLREFEDWIDNTVLPRLEAEYGFDD